MLWRSYSTIKRTLVWLRWKRLGEPTAAPLKMESMVSRPSGWGEAMLKQRYPWMTSRGWEETVYIISDVDMCGRDQIRRRYRTSVEDAGGQGITGRTVRFR
ncbi:unnamed protein product [Brassica napus]|uniref:(rape) hypothetical protein n=1 Tax=Brassica napus TaxID=3708 RepID=A0A816V5K3_BRANA|nr:unnamed protein product [Brassica napus]